VTGNVRSHPLQSVVANALILIVRGRLGGGTATSLVHVLADASDTPSSRLISRSDRP
jgi:hypothetical protein